MEQVRKSGSEAARNTRVTRDFSSAGRRMPAPYLRAGLRPWVTCVLLLAGTASGATRTWTGAGGNDNWSTSANWGGIAPLPGDDLVFAGSTRLTPNNDMTPGTSFNSITFSAGSGLFTVGGNYIALTGGASAIVSNASGGVMIFNNPITFNAAPTISAAAGGMLELGGSLSAGAFNTAWNCSGNIGINGVLSGTGSLTKNGSGALQLNGANTYTGTTNVAAGVIVLNNVSALGTTAAGTTVAAGSALDLKGVNYSAPEPLTLNGTGLAGGGALINSAVAPATFAGLITLGSSASIMGGAGTIAITHPGTITGTGYNLVLGGNAGGALKSNLATGSGALTKQDNGAWVLTGSNTYTGATTVSAGALVPLNPSALGGTSSGTTVTAGATLDLHGVNYTNPEPLTLNGLGPGNVGALSNDSIGAATFAGLITLGSSSSVKCGAGPISLTHSGTITGTGFSLTLGGNSSGDLASIVGTGSGALTKTDAGNWTLSGHNTYNGPTTINAGTLILGAADVIPDGSDVTAHGTLEMNGFSETIGSLAGTGFVDNSAGSGTFTLTTGGTSVQTTFSGVIKNTAQTVALTKEGAAYMLLTGNNTYAGLTTVNGGVLSIGDNGTTGTLSGNCVVASGAAVRFARSDAQTYSGNISGAGQVMKINAGALTMTGTSTYTGSTLITGGAFTIGSGSTYGSVTGTLILAGGGSGSIVFNRSDNLTYSGQITGTDATGSVVKNGPNTLTLSGANDYTGATLVNSGILTLGNPDALGSSAGGTTVASGAALDLGGVNYTKAESLTLNGTGIAYNGALMNTSATQAGFAGPITLGSAASIVGGPNSGIDIANTGAISGGYPLTLGGSQGGFLAGTLPGGDLIKEGTGGWTLTGVNPLALANLTLSGGTLFLGAGLTHSVSTNLSLTGGILDFGSSTLRFSGSSANFSSLSGVVPGTGTLDFNGTTGIQAYTPQNTAANPSVTHSGAGTLRLNFALNCQSFSQTAGILDFNGYDLTTVNGGGFTISNGNAASISGLDGRMVTVAGNVSLTGASANSPLNLDPVSVWYLSGHGTINVSKASLRYANASYNPGVCADCRDLGNNANWGFPITWDGGGSNTSWSTAENWGSKSVPTRYQDAIFNSTSSKDVMLTADVEVRSLTFASGYMGRLDFSSHKLTIAAGDADFQGDEAISAGTGTLEFAGDGAQNLRPKSGTLLPDIVKGGAGTTMVAGQLAAGSLALAGGVFHLGNTALTQSVGAVSGTGGLEFGSANLSARGNVDLYTINVIATTANTLAFTGTSAQTYRPKLSEPDLNLMQNGSVSTTLIGDLNTPVLTLASGTFGFGVNRIATISSSVVSTGGDVDFGTANTLNFTGGTFDLSGLTNVLPGTGTIYFQSATTQTFIPHPTATHPGIVRSTGGGLLDLNGNFKGQYMRVETGTLNLGSGRAHEIGTFSSSGGTLDFGSSSLRISGSSANFANLSAMVAGTGLLEFTGSGGQAFAPHASAFPSIRQSGSGTTALSANDLTCGNLDVTGGEFDVAARALNPTGTVSVSAGTLNVTGGIAAIIGNLSVTGGALRLPASNSFGVTGNITIASAAAIYHNSGTITLNGTTAGRTIDIDNTIYAITLNGAGGEWTVVNHGLFGDGALTLSAGTLKLGASPMNSMGSLASNSSAATLDFGASTLRILYGSANFTGLAALVPGTGTLDFNNLTGTQMLTPMNGSVTHPIVTHTGAGAFQLAAYPLVCKGFLNSAGGLDFNGRDITVNNGGDFSITNGTPATIAGLDGATITVAGTATLAGASSGSRLNLSPAGNWTLAATGALTGSFLTLGNSNASVQAGACSNCSANTGNSNWTFSTSWDGGGGDYKWSTAANWGSDAVPSASEDVAFDGLSNDNALLDVDGAVKSITFTNGYSGDFSFTTHTLSVTGGIANFSSGGNIIAGTGTLAFTGTGAQTFIPKTGMSFPNIHQNGNAGTTTVSGAALTAGNLTLGLGTFNLGAGMTHTVNGISGAGALNFGSSDVNAKGDVDLGSATLSAAAGRILAFIGLTAQNYVPNASETGLSLIQNGNGGTTILASNVSAPSLTILNGTLHLGAGLTHTIASTFTVTGGGLDFGSSTLKLQAADVDLRLLSALTPGTGILQFTRASSQTFVPHASLPLPRVEQFGTGVTTVTTNPIVTADILMIRNGAFQLGTGLTHVVGGVNGSGGVGTLDFGTSNLKVSAGNAYLGNLAGVTTTGTGSLEFSAASGTQIFTTLAGFTNPAIVHSGAGTLRQGSATSFTSFNQSSGTMDLNGYDLATTGDFTLSNGTSVSFAGLSGSTLNIGGNASISGASAASKTNLDPANAWSLNVAGTLNANLASLAHSDASGSTSTGICGDCANVTGNSNWNFATVWKGAGPDGNWSTALNWGSQSVPTAGENVVFNSTSVKDVLLDVDAEVNSISLNTGYTGNLDFTTHTLTINGNADFDGGETITPGTGTLAFTGSAAQTFQAGNATNFPGIVVGGAVGTTLTSALAAGNLTLASGSLNLGTGFIHSFADVSGSGSLDFNGSELDARGNVDLSGLTVTATSANILAFTGNGSQAFTPKASMTALKLSKTGSGITTVTGYGFTTPLMTLANGTLQLGSDLNHTAADLALTGGSLNMGSARLSTPAGTVDFSNLTAITFPTGNSALEFTGNSAQTFITKIGLTFPSIIQNGAGGTTVVTNNPIAKKLSLISGTLHLGSSRRFTVSDSLVALGGGLDFGTSATLVFGGAAFDMQPISPMTAGTGSLEFNGTNPQTYTPKVSATHPALNVSGNGGTTILANGLQTSSIQVANGTLHLGTNLVHTTYGFTGTSGGLDFGSSTLEYSGAGINLALLTTVTPGTGKLRFTGASATLQPHATDTLPDIQQSATGTTTVITNGLKTGSLSPLSGSFHFGSGLNHSIGSIFMGAGSAGPNGSLDFGSSEVHISADADLGSLTALTPGSGKLYFDAATGTQIFVPKAGGSAHPPVYHTGAGTLRLATNNLACAAFTQTAGALDLNGNNLTTSGGFTVTNGSPASFANLGGRTLTVGGNASLTGTSSASRLGMGPTSAWTLAVTGALTAAFVNLAFNTASLTPGTCTGCVDAGSNNNWVFPVEWDGGGPNGNWSTALNWSSDQVPGPTDIISFNATNRNATLDVDVTVKDITFTGAYTGNFDFASHALSLSGNSDFRSGGAIIPGNGSLALIGTGAHSLIPKSGGGLPIINQNGPGKTTIAVLPLASAGILLSSGTLDLGANFIHATGPVSGTGTLDFNSSTLRVSGNFNVSSANVVPGSGNLEFIGASAKTFSPKAAAAYPAITQSGTGGLVVSGNGFTAPYLSLSAGTLSLGSGLTHVLTTGLSLTGGILDFGSSTLKTSATTVDLSGLDSVSGGSGYLEFTRSSAQTFTPKAGDPHPALIQSGNGTTTFAKALNSVPRLTVAAGGVNLGAGWTHSVGEIATTGGSLDFGASTLEASGLNADFSGLGTMTASSGTLRFTAATGNQTLSARAGQNHPAIEHIGAGLLILNAADLLCASFRQTAGRLDLNGRDITVSTGGFFDILNGNSGTLLNLSGRTLTVGGDAKLLGLKTDHLNLDPNSAWIIFVEGSLKAVHSNLKNCIATEMAGLADSSLNLGGNVNWTFLDTIKPDNVTGFVARALGGHSVELTWTAPTAADADSVMLRYRTDGVEPQNPGDGILWRTVPVAKTADTATGTPEKTVFHFAAFARDSSGNYALGNGENADSAFTPDVTAPAGILAFTATGLTATATSLDWTPSAASDADTLVIRYRTDGAYPVNETDGSLWKKLSAQATADTVTGLANNTVYHFGAFVRDTSGNFSPGTAAARDTALYQIPVLGGIAIGDAAGRTADVDPALLLTWSGADSLRVSLIADTAAALWTGLRAADSLSLASGADGMRILMAQFKNLYGSRSAWYRDTTLLDRTAPVANLKLDTVHSWRNWPNSVSGSALDAIAGTDSVWMIRSREADGAYFNGTGWTTVADTARFRADSAFSAPMPNSAMATGYYNITVSARDKLGNRSAPLTIRVKYQENRAPVASASTVADTALQNQQVSWKIDFGEYDAGDSVFTAAANIPAWLTLTQTPGPAEGGFAAHRIYVLAGKPLQSDVGNATVTVQVRDAGGMTFTYSKSFAVIDVNDPPVFTAGQDYFGAKEDSVSRFIPRYADADPKDRHSLALLEAPAWVMIADSALEFKPGSRDVGPAVVRATVSDGMLLDTLELKVNVANMNDPPFAFPSANWQMMARWKEDVADSFSVVVVDLDQGDNISLATVLPAWITYQGTIDPVEGFNRFFRFAVKPTQADTGAFSLKLRFQDAAGAFSELPLTAKVTAVNDVPTALILGQENQAGAARIALDVTDQDGNTASTRFHYRLIGASGDTLRRGICPTALLSLHPLADGDYRLAVSAEDEEGLRQPGFTIANVRISGATNLFLDTARWHMIAYPGRGLSAGALGAGAALTTWDESAGDGSPLGRYAIGKSADSLARGKGYWVRVAKPVTVGAPFPELLDKPYTMRLTHGKQGWNQVGNPFPYFVDLSKTGLTWWEWDSERRDLVNAKGILKPWSAYWVQVAKDTVLTIKDQPYFSVGAVAGGGDRALAKSGNSAAAPTPASHHGSEASAGWTLQMALQAGCYQDQANFLGVRDVTGLHAGAVNAPGSAGQIPDAPKFGDYVALHFGKPGDDAYRSRAVAAAGTGFETGMTGEPSDLGYAEDFRPRMGEDEEWWDFTVENSGTGFSNAELSLPGLGNLEALGLHAFLVRKGKAFPLAADSPATLHMEGVATYYSLVVTPHADFTERLKGNFSISQNFPNPVRTFTSFRFVLPQTWDAAGKRETTGYRLRLNVYDYSGRLTARVADATFKPGSHTLVWRPQALDGGVLAKAAYVYRLEVPGFTKSLKLLVK